MSVWNYVVTAHKPTNVTHSCVGNFTGPQELNLIIAKCTRIEIHLLTPQGLQPMLDVPIYGRIATLELFRPHGETQDLLFIATERYKFCVLQWDAEISEVITRAMGDVSDRIGRPTDNGQIGIIDPDCRLIGLHLYDGLFKVFFLDKKRNNVLELDSLHVCIKFFFVSTFENDSLFAYQVIPFDNKGQLKEAFNIRYPSSLSFVHSVTKFGGYFER
nr:DNA damage-binding protein 1 [Ipomoea batatas]